MLQPFPISKLLIGRLHTANFKISTYKIMDKFLFIRQNPKDFTCEEHYSSFKRILRHRINLLGLLLV